MSRYYQLLRDPRWQRKRLEVMQRAEFKCEECHSSEDTLNVHHRYYVAHRLPWEYPDFCFQCLCEKCHTSKIECCEDDRREGNCMFAEWEQGLNYFRDNIQEAAGICNSGQVLDFQSLEAFRKPK